MILNFGHRNKKNFGHKMGKFGKKISFFGNFLTNPRDFHKSAVKFHEILLPPPHPPPKIFLRPLPLPKIFGRDYVWTSL
jgi:hypothetical protein